MPDISNKGVNVPSWLLNLLWGLSTVFLIGIYTQVQQLKDSQQETEGKVNLGEQREGYATQERNELKADVKELERQVRTLEREVERLKDN